MKKKRKLFLLGWILLAALIVWPFSPAYANPEETNQEYTVYMPLALRGQAGIHGRVTLNGSPAANIPLALRFYNGASWSTTATTTTGTAGEFAFEGAAGLAEGQEYYVLYQNEAGTEGQLWIWVTRVLSSYQEAASVLIGYFDIGDIELVSPPDEASVSLPQTFQWNQRTASPGDTYEFNLLDPEDPETYFYTYPPLGYVGSYTLNFLPFGFQSGVDYVWEVWVYSPDGGFGVSSEDRWISFNQPLQ
jgi:hypothetical protein